jgi:hypothetical protein
MSDLPCATKFLLAIPDELGELRPSYGGVVHSQISNLKLARLTSDKLSPRHQHRQRYRETAPQAN